ncbi:MAG: hypothetical protein COT88_01040 [Candidatus Colwellbacteria bacterium CG10_big_fil_rev_8_21_14_0_10_41_28]|uniref:Uncharacterized protein n=1 Tax=Candidatus Colwellbacteria bacterium CG10_big_fil_rev_8_21_14_0_10_41_28 TaxID=1974539 RepID=A0A2H0VHJ1_9BACT|nr:MAG: hypothetical protein COT88_01040 [Candidatus Colwellbacteria bacterium CG10_big_fil_rev_8_21_14_0_10_41_28]
MAKVNTGTKGLVWLVGFLLVAAVVAFGVAWAVSFIGGPTYYAVAMTDGTTYFGEVSRFPKLTISDPHTIQLVQQSEDPNDVGISLNPLRNSLWAPKTLELNRENVLFISKVGPDSQLEQALIASADLEGQPAAAPTGAAAPAPVPGSGVDETEVEAGN